MALRGQQLRPQQLSFERFVAAQSGRQLIERIVGRCEVALGDARFSACQPCAGLPSDRIEPQHGLRRQKIAPGIAVIAELGFGHPTPQGGVRVGRQRCERKGQARIAVPAHHELRRALHRLQGRVALEPRVVCLYQPDFAQRFRSQLIGQ